MTSVPEPSPAPARVRADPRLVAVNAALVVALAALLLIAPRPGHAQPADDRAGPAAARPRGQYTMLSGQYKGGTSSAVYILDTSNQELVALRWDRTNKRFEPIGYRNIADDARFFRGAR